MKIGLIFITVIALASYNNFSNLVQALKCQTDEGITEEEARKMVKKCTKKTSDYFDDKSYQEYDNYDSNEDGGEQHNRFSNKDWDEKNVRNHQTNNYNMRNNGNQENHRGSNYARSMRQDYLNQKNHQNYNDNFQKHGFNNHGNTSNRSDNDQSCLFQCFFQELKSINNDGLPDKHKVLQALTRGIRDHELKDFYTDSIQECFHMVDLEQRREKCNYSKNLIMCLTERAKTNCNDWDGSSIIF